LLGNITVAGLAGLAFIFGGISVGKLNYAIVPAVFAFLVNLIREIVKDMEDIEGDSLNSVITLPKKFGTVVSVRVIFALTILLILATIYPFMIKYYKIEYFISVMIFVNVIFVYFLKSIIYDSSKDNLKRMSTLLKVNMVLGLISIFLGG
jgi:geranylgeranylglycerol-phosphate geranylgeranyltransferase